METIEPCEIIAMMLLLNVSNFCGHSTVFNTLNLNGAAGTQQPDTQAPSRHPPRHPAGTHPDTQTAELYLPRQIGGYKAD